MIAWVGGFIPLGNLGPPIQVVSVLMTFKLTLLICLDLADAPIVSPQFSEEEMAMDDAMVVDHDCEQF